MRWNQWYRLKSYFRSALWIVPFIALLLENVAIRLEIPAARKQLGSRVARQYCHS